MNRLFSAFSGFSLFSPNSPKVPQLTECSPPKFYFYGGESDVMVHRDDILDKEYLALLEKNWMPM